MEIKKNPKVDLEKKKFVFTIGFYYCFIACLCAFEYKNYDKSSYNLGDLNLDDLEEEIIPITKQEQKLLLLLLLPQK